MVHWIDRLSKAVARTALMREGPGAARAAEPLSLVDRDDATLVQAGPCEAMITGNQLVRRYSTQVSLADRGLLSLVATTTRNFDSGASFYHLTIDEERSMVLDLRVDSAPGRPPAVTLTQGGRGQDAHVLAGTIDEDRWRWTIDGRSDPELDQLMAAEVLDLTEGDTFAGLPIDALGMDDELRAGVERLAYRALRDAPTCVVVPQAMHTMSGEQFPDCVECVDKCDDDRFECGAAAAAKAASCWVGYAVCLAWELSKCMGKEADCYNACHADGGACCPRKCERMGYAECCPSGGTCCGARCCDPSDVCADPGHDLCCSPIHGDPCGDHCCDPGWKCANAYRGFCCPADAGAYCPKIWDEEHWSPDCCPPGQVCADGDTGLCCDEGHGPVCGDGCCQRHEVCQNGICCDPRSLCGHGEQAVCCDGECRDGFCCGKPSHMCGDTCCPPFNPCCEIDGRRVCCGAYEECMPGGCCPDELVCGKTCCDHGYRCDDPKRDKCVRCEGDTVACLTADYETGDRFSICCLPGVDCCNGKCCEPGTMCCQPGGGEPGCYPSHYCVH